jgi:hypothetical protein
MKALAEIEIGDELNRLISDCVATSGLSKADIVRHALRIGLPQFAARFQPAPLWLELRIREALVERAEKTSPVQFKKAMKAIAGGR